MCDSKIIERVRKLLAMANDTSSPNESAMAAKRARNLMDKHQISMTAIQSEGAEFGSNGFTAGNGRSIPRWKQSLAVAVAQYNDCIVKREDSNLEFLGFLDDSNMALLMMNYLTVQMESLIKKAKADELIHGRTEINGFRIGAVAAIRKLIMEDLENRKSGMVDAVTGTSLIVAKTMAVAEYFGDPKYKQAKVKGLGMAGALGYEQGSKVMVNGFAIEGEQAPKALN